MHLRSKENILMMLVVLKLFNCREIAIARSNETILVSHQRIPQVKSTWTNKFGSIKKVEMVKQENLIDYLDSHFLQFFNDLKDKIHEYLDAQRIKITDWETQPDINSIISQVETYVISTDKGLEHMKKLSDQSSKDYDCLKEIKPKITSIIRELYEITKLEDPNRRNKYLQILQDINNTNILHKLTDLLYAQFYIIRIKRVITMIVYEIMYQNEIRAAKQENFFENRQLSTMKKEFGTMIKDKESEIKKIFTKDADIPDPDKSFNELIESVTNLEKCFSEIVMRSYINGTPSSSILNKVLTLESISIYEFLQSVYLNKNPTMYSFFVKLDEPLNTVLRIEFEKLFHNLKNNINILMGLKLELQGLKFTINSITNKINDHITNNSALATFKAECALFILRINDIIMVKETVDLYLLLNAVYLKTRNSIPMLHSGTTT